MMMRDEGEVGGLLVTLVIANEVKLGTVAGKIKYEADSRKTKYSSWIPGFLIRLRTYVLS